MDLDCAREELVDLGLHEGHLQYLLDGGTLVGILYQHFRKQFFEIRRIDLRQGRVGSFEDLLDEALHVLSIKCVIEGGNFVEDAS